jgi:hypothetical protein
VERDKDVNDESDILSEYNCPYSKEMIVNFAKESQKSKK